MVSATRIKFLWKICKFLNVMDQKKLIKEFPNKGWRLRGLNKLLKKAARNWNDGKMKWQH